MTVALKVGDRVTIDSYEGFGGPATIIATRPEPTSHFKVRMDDDNPPPFWAHDFEVRELNRPAAPDPPGIAATREHIALVRRLLGRVIDDLIRRSDEHDRSKLESPEAEIFEEFTPRLAGCTYGSDEYKSYLAAMKPALDHHYLENRHHPEHFAFEFGRLNPEIVANGHAIRDMSLVDLLEMLVDWKAASTRHADGDVRRSVEINQKRFGYSDELKRIFLNTLAAIEG